MPNKMSRKNILGNLPPAPLCLSNDRETIIKERIKDEVFAKEGTLPQKLMFDIKIGEVYPVDREMEPTGRARGIIIYSPPSPKDGYGETSARGNGFHLAEAPLRLPPRVKPVVPGGGGWRSERRCL